MPAKTPPTACADVLEGRAKAPKKQPPAGCADLATPAKYVPATTKPTAR